MTNPPGVFDPRTLGGRSGARRWRPSAVAGRITRLDAAFGRRGVFAGIRLRIWILCGVFLVGCLALVVTGLMPDPVEIAGPDGRREAAGGEVHQPGEPSRDGLPRAPDAEQGRQTPRSDTTPWDESGGDTTPRLRADTTPRPQTSGGPEAAAGGRTAAGPASDAEEIDSSQPEEQVDAGHDDDGPYWVERAPVPEEDARSREDEPVPEEDARSRGDDFVGEFGDGAGETLVEMFVQRRLFARPDENEAAVYELADEFVAEMSPEERQMMLFGFPNPVGWQHERLSDFMGRPLP